MTVSQFVTLAKSRGYTTKEQIRKFTKWYLSKNYGTRVRG